jgi:hypothetical protein
LLNRRDVAEILPKRRKTLINQSINHIIKRDITMKLCTIKHIATLLDNKRKLFLFWE